MKATNFVEAIQVFLMDILAFLIPGATFLIVTWFLLYNEVHNFTQGLINVPPARAADWLIAGILSYIFGYILQGIGETVVTKGAESLTRFSALRWALPGIQRYEDLDKQIGESQWFLEAKRRLSYYTKADLSSLNFRELRNVAMSISSSWVRYVYRYTYTWQLCLGTAVGLVIIGIVMLGVAFASVIPATNISFSASRLWWLLPLFVSAIFLLNRRYRYYSITMRIPFSIALAEIPQLESQSLKYTEGADIRIHSTEEAHMKLPKVYLSGGFHSGWQDKVIAEVRNVEFYDPRSHELQNSNQYAIWDTHHVRRADILFAYMEKDNPSGYGLATEIGYARSLGKTVILVDEKSQVDEQFRRHFAIVRELSDVVLESLDEGIALLRKFASDGCVVR